MIASQQNSQLRLERVTLAAPIGPLCLLKDISFEVFQGECISLVGASGSGKTSLLRLLNRLIEVTGGSIYLENRNIKQIPVVELRQQITLVLQEPKLLGMTVGEALAYPLVLRSFGQREIEGRLSNWIERLHVPTEWLNRTEVQLSAGQRQLVAIARALVIQPKILLLDEPTSALDVGRAFHVLKVLSELARESQTTILMVNHQLEQARQFCTHLLHLQNGELVQDISVDRVDWERLRQTLIQLEGEADREWV